MYIDTSGHGYYKGTGQCHTRAPFLILMQCEHGYFQSHIEEHCPKCKFKADCEPGQIRGIVRKVAMSQCGHFMMGCARIKNTTITLSGSYGSDGLTVEVSPEIYQVGTPLPQELFDAWNNGEGWNSAGKEAPDMREWAKTL